MKKEYVIEYYKGMKFYRNASKTFDKDFETVKTILDKGIENLTKADRIKLIMIYKPSYHKSGKIEKITSFDSSATNCKFCESMRRAAKERADHICNLCYDKAQEESFKGVNVLNRHSLNLLIMSSVRFTREELALIDVTKLNRINSSGDTENEIYAENIILLIWVNETVRFGYWAKNVIAVIKACRKYGKPTNVTLVQSSLFINRPSKKAEFFDIVFTVYLDEKDVLEAVKNGSGECNGKKCMDCGFRCYLKDGWLGFENVAEVLRANKEEKAKIRAFLENR